MKKTDLSFWRKMLGVMLCLCSLTIVVNAQPKSEVRAVWLTTNGGMDWPKGIYTEAEQKTALVDILDKLATAHFNTIVLQVQVKGDVIWDSKIQPFMRDFSGDGSKGMTWDVCKYVIEECHKRNMECHAWIVPYRVGTANEAARYKNNSVVKHVTTMHPEMCVLYNNAYYLDPGLPEVRTYLLDLYKEMVTNYDFDGTNFDYTRYPGSDFEDSSSYAKYGNGKDKADWRRENINTFVGEFYDMVKSIKPNMKVGAAPIGTYKNVSGYGNMTAYGSVYQDAAEWMRRGKHDLLIPQMYWNEKYGFSPNMTTWVDNCDGRQLVVGLAPYKMDDSNNWDVSVVTDQIEKTRAKAGMSGNCYFRADHVIGNTTKVKELYKQIVENYYAYPAHIVPMDYNGVTKPNAPENVKVKKNGNTYSISWEAVNPKDDVPVKYYCVYASTSSDVDITDIKNCVGFAVKDTEFTYTSDSSLNFVVTAFDINYYESHPAKPTTSVTDIINDNVKVYVNDGIVTISGADDNANVAIYNAGGAIVYRGANKDISIAGKGVYFVKVSNKIFKILK